MITEAILSVFLFLPKLIVDLLPSVSFLLPNDVASSIDTILYGIGYVLPMKALAMILMVSLAIDVFRVAMALIVRIKSFVPNMGD